MAQPSFLQDRRHIRGQDHHAGLIDPHTHFALSAGYLATHYIGPIDSPGPQGINRGLPTRREVIAKLREADSSAPDPTAPLIAWG